MKTSPYLTLSLNALEKNFKTILSKGYSPQDVIAVVKDNAYGCGAVDVSKKLFSLGVNEFAVARFNEAVELRENNIKGNILVFGEVLDSELKVAIDMDISLSINSLSSLDKMGKSNLNLKIAVNIDTGMGRLGIVEDEVLESASLLKKYTNLQKTAIYTHFANSDNPDKSSVEFAIDKFMTIKNTFKESGIGFSCFHLFNSAAIIYHDKIPNALIRPGIMLYGSKPDPKRDAPVKLQDILSLKAPVIKIKRVKKGTPISYGSNFVAKKECDIATLAIGYAHGFFRSLGENLDIYINRKKYSIAGNVTMDCIMVDLGIESNIEVGDEALLVGTDQGDAICIDDLAIRANTIGYEILCSIGRIREREIVG